MHPSSLAWKEGRDCVGRLVCTSGMIELQKINSKLVKVECPFVTEINSTLLSSATSVILCPFLAVTFKERH